MGSRFGSHLTPEQLVDAADNVADAAADRHLAACPACRAQLMELRSTMSSVGAIGNDVPEPSTLFWSNFQQRVVEAAAAERQAEHALTRFARSLRPAFLVPAAAALVIAVAVFLTNVAPRPSVSPSTAVPRLTQTPVAATSASAPRELLRDSMEDDPSLQLIADLAVDMDWTAADAAALTPSGSAEHAVSHLDVKDLQELQRLLRAEMGT